MYEQAIELWKMIADNHACAIEVLLEDDKWEGAHIRADALANAITEILYLKGCDDSGTFASNRLINDSSHRF